MKILILLFMASISYAGAFETRILYVRHGEVPGNNPDPAKYIYTGCGTNQHLTDEGHAQALKCARNLAQLKGKVSAIYSSNLFRAIETATPIAKELGLEVEQRDELREISWGIADGQLVSDMTREYGDEEDKMKELYPDFRERWNHLPVFKDAEKFNDLLDRSLKELGVIAQQHQGETVIVVGHGRVLKTLIAHAKGSERNIPYPNNCGIAEFIYSSEKPLEFIKVEG